MLQADVGWAVEEDAAVDANGVLDVVHANWGLDKGKVVAVVIVDGCADVELWLQPGVCWATCW